MKVSEMPYQRITVEEFKEQAEKIIAKIKAAKSAEDLKAARDEYNKISEEVDTVASLANCRFTLNTRDEFYNAEMDYYDNAMPLFCGHHGCHLLIYPSTRRGAFFRPQTQMRVHP